MIQSVIGKVNKIRLAKSNYLLPIYEAIANSLDSLESVSLRNKKITIQIIRDENQIIINNENSLKPIKGFIVSDNGIGFDSINYKSFNTGDSILKAKKGGKGVGRFSWLKAFEYVSIESKYKEKEKFYHRMFDFVCSESGIEDHSVEESKDEEHYTKITFNSYKTKYKKICPKETKVIANRIIEHFLEYFISDNCPEITLYDEERIILNHYFKNEIKIEIEKDDIKLKESNLRVNFLKIFSSVYKKNQINLTALKRVVKSFDIKNFLPDLSHKIESFEGDFYYVLYVSSEYLDKNVNDLRTDFNIPKNSTPNDIDYKEIICEEDILNSCINLIEIKLTETLKPIRDKKISEIKDYITGIAPQYKFIINNYEDDLINIDPAKIKNKNLLNIELFKVKQKRQLEMNEIINNILEETIPKEDYDDIFNKYSNLITEIGRCDLAEYVTHRKSIIELFEANLYKIDESYSNEEIIHNMLFPMRKTSNNIPLENQNLWMIDERLTFNKFLASDKPFCSQKEILDSSSRLEPDIISYFNNKLVYSDNVETCNTIIIIEFKKPGRESYTDNEDPVKQILNYVRAIQSGKIKIADSRVINCTENTQFYGYIICDPCDKISKFAEDNDLFPTTDNLGFVGYKARKKTWIEIITFDKLLKDAKARNKILFDKLFVKN